MDTKSWVVGGVLWEKLGDWDWYIYTIDAMYKTDNWWETTVPRELYSVLWGDLNGKEIQKKGDICISKANSFCSPAETDTAV